jgi:hypothetical protein
MSDQIFPQLSETRIQIYFEYTMTDTASTISQEEVYGLDKIEPHVTASSIRSVLREKGKIDTQKLLSGIIDVINGCSLQDLKMGKEIQKNRMLKEFPHADIELACVELERRGFILCSMGGSLIIKLS